MSHLTTTDSFRYAFVTASTTTDYTSGTGFLTIPDYEAKWVPPVEPARRRCLYCGVGVKDEERVTCKQCGAPLAE